MTPVGTHWHGLLWLDWGVVGGRQYRAPMTPMERNAAAHEQAHDAIAQRGLADLTQQERDILAHAHAHHIDREEWGDTEAMFGRDWVLTDAKAEWLSEQYPDVDPALTKHYYDRRHIDWEALDRESTGCGKQHASEWVQNDDGDFVRAEALEGREFDSA